MKKYNCEIFVGRVGFIVLDALNVKEKPPCLKPDLNGSLLSAIYKGLHLWFAFWNSFDGVGG